MYFTVPGRLTTAVQEVTTNKEKATLQSHQSSDYDQEIHLLRKHLDGLEHEKEKDQKVIDELQGALTRAREVSTTVVYSPLYGMSKWCNINIYNINIHRTPSVFDFCPHKTHDFFVREYFMESTAGRRMLWCLRWMSWGFHRNITHNYNTDVFRTPWICASICSFIYTVRTVELGVIFFNNVERKHAMRWMSEAPSRGTARRVSPVRGGQGWVITNLS